VAANSATPTSTSLRASMNFSGISSESACAAERAISSVGSSTDHSSVGAT